MLAPIDADILRLPGIRHAFFTRQGGVSEGLYASLNGGQGSEDRPEAVAENRARMAAHLGVAPENFVSLYQIHSAEAVRVGSPWRREDRPRADGMATARAGLALAIGTADCGPLLFADPEARVIGAAHAGWKGAKAGVIEATLAAMEAEGARRARIRVALGPMLRQPNYEVGPDFRDAFLADDPAFARFFSPGDKPTHPRFDLPGYIRSRLEAAGVSAIEDTGLCTYADPERFYSYRRKTHLGEADYGRLIAAIVLEG